MVTPAVEAEFPVGAQVGLVMSDGLRHVLPTYFDQPTHRVIGHRDSDAVGTPRDMLEIEPLNPDRNGRSLLPPVKAIKYAVAG